MELLKKRKILFSIIIVSFSTIVISSCLLKSCLVVGSDVKKHMDKMNKRLIMELNSDYFLDYAKNDIILLHNSFYLVCMRKNNDDWNVDLLVDLRKIRSNYIQGSKYTSFNPSADGNYIYIQNKDIYKEEPYPIYLIDLKEKNIKKYKDGILPSELNINFKKIPNNFSPDQTRIFSLEGHTVDQLEILDVNSSKKLLLSVEKSYINDFHFLDNNTIINLFIDKKINNKVGRIGDYRLVFYDIDREEKSYIQIQ